MNYIRGLLVKQQGRASSICLIRSAFQIRPDALKVIRTSSPAANVNG